MDHPDHHVFLAAIDRREKVSVTFTHPGQPAANLRRTCVPLDYGPLPSPTDHSDRYHFWDPSLKGPGRLHFLTLRPVQILAIECDAVTFDPAEVITWNHEGWHYRRNWGV